jgi:DNA modification methylase
MSSARIITGGALDVLRTLPPESVRCVVTSPPYWGLRDYGVPPSVWGGQHDCAHEWGGEVRVPWANAVSGPSCLPGGPSAGKQTAGKQFTKMSGAFCSICGAWRGCLGLEPTYSLYVEHVVEIFADVHRVLAKDGTLWLNLGDCYATGAGTVGDHPGGGAQGERWKGYRGARNGHEGKHGYIDPGIGPMTQPNRLPQPGLKPKDMVGIPWRVAFALQDDGWWLRSDNIWHKPNPMPESVTDRPTKAHEYLFLLSKSERYHFDAAAIAEPATGDHPRNIAEALPSAMPGASPHKGIRRSGNKTRVQGADRGRPDSHLGSGIPWEGSTRNKRTVWTINTQPFPGAHFAVMPEALAEPCILAGSGGGDLVLDPFAGSGTVGVVALKHGRDFLGIELNPTYAEMARNRIHDDAPLLNRQEVRTAT